MFDHRHYVPALKWRMGEFRALQDLSELSKARLTPLVEITPIPWDFEADCPAKNIDQHLATVPEQMVYRMGCEAPRIRRLGASRIRREDGVWKLTQ